MWIDTIPNATRIYLADGKKLIAFEVLYEKKN